MTEVGTGWYKYDYAAGDQTKNYAYLCDSVTLVGSERYAAGDWISAHADILETEIENGVKAKHVLAAVLAYMVNKRSGGGTVALTYRNNADTLDRIFQAVNDMGEVSVSALDVSDIP